MFLLLVYSNIHRNRKPGRKVRFGHEDNVIIILEFSEFQMFTVHTRGNVQ